MTVLVPQPRPEGLDIDGLGARVAELDALVGARHAEVARVRADLDAFKVAYRQRVGLLHEQLDELELSIAEAELGEIEKRLGNESEAAAPGTAPGDAPPSGGEPAPRFVSDGVRKLFRDVAKAIHPDLASDDTARDRRHALMIEANRAYALGDEEQLRGILSAWERSPEAVQGTDAEATRLRLERRIAQAEEQLDGLSHDLADLQATPMWQLKVMVDDAAAAGKDLVRDMVRRLKREIMAAQNRLDAMRPPSPR
ncbi:MAG: hypothetical protein AB7G23_12545 [Vicinamibacterales bacterium]